ncbi:MAG TPA: hypothetical protein DCG57_18350, partial [Candidatus Riflebacteria bacterium]|nr:hypothetical protein [Candidatus Riflebacteria bacterium]
QHESAIVKATAAHKMSYILAALLTGYLRAIKQFNHPGRQLVAHITESFNYHDNRPFLIGNEVPSA